MGAIDAAGLTLIGETPGTGLMRGRLGLVGLFGLVGLVGLFGLIGLFGLGRAGLLGACGGLLPGMFGLLGWLWAERNEMATVQIATTPKYIIGV